MSNKIDLTGKVFNKWTVIQESKVQKKDSCILWTCVCECGTVKDVRGDQLKQGLSNSCGCYKIEKAKAAIIHGASRRSGALKEYAAWQSMKARCYNPNFDQYYDYGGRGITVCERWLNSFENFFADMGKRPSPKHSLDRFPDTNGNYGPSNCRWATKKEQNSNTRANHFLEYKGRRMIITDWATELGIHLSSIHYYFKRNWEFDKIVEHFYNKKTAA